MELVTKWLAGSRNYFVGVALFKQFSTDEKLKKYFAGVRDPNKQSRLEKELQTLSNGISPKPASKIQKESGSMPASADLALNAFTNEWQPLYQRMNYLRHELDKHQGDEENVVRSRSAIAGEILELEQQCMAVWDRRDQYLITGKVPEVRARPADVPEDPFDLAKLIHALKRNIRRNKQKAAEHPDKPHYPILVKRDEEMLEEILKKLNDGKH